MTNARGFRVKALLLTGGFLALMDAEAALAQVSSCEQFSSIADALENFPEVSGPFVTRADLSKRTEYAIRPMTESEQERYNLLNGVAFRNYTAHSQLEILSALQDILYIEERTFGPDHPETLGTMSALEQAYYELGDFSKSEFLARRANSLSLAIFGKFHPYTAERMNNLGDVLIDLFRYKEAESLLCEALIIRIKIFGIKNRQTIISLSNYGFVMSLIRTSEDEENFHEHLVDLSGEVLGRDDQSTMIISRNLGGIYLSRRKFEEARLIFLQDLKWADTRFSDDHPMRINALSNYASALEGLGQFQEAERLHAEVLEHRERVFGERHPYTLAALKNLARLRLKASDLAPLSFSAAHLALEGHRSRYSEVGESGIRGELQQERDFARIQSAERLFADSAWVRGEAFPAEAPGLRVESFGALQGAGSGPAARAIAETAARRYAVEAGAGELVSERARLVEQWAAAERRNIAAQAQSGGQDRAAREAMERDMAVAEARIQAIDAELKVKAPRYFAIVNQPPLDVAEAQELLGEDEAVLIVVPSEFGTHVMALTRTELVWHRADIKAGEVAAKVARLREDLNPDEVPAGARGPDRDLALRARAPAFDRTTAHDLYAKLIAPVAATLEGKTHLFIAADGALASLPFGVLVTEAPQAGSDDSDPEVLRSTPWFADSHALVQIPSLQSLAYLRRFNTGEGEASGSSAAPRATTLRTAASGFAGFGDPVLSGPSGASRGAEAVNFAGSGVTESGSALMNPDLLRTLDRISGTRTELRTISSMLGASEDALRLDVRMTETDFRTRGRLDGVKILHLATHGLKAADAGRYGQSTEPGLVFTPPAQATSQDDGYLSASEIVGIDLTGVDWVILSACDTAAPSGRPGEAGLSGLARAFFYAGAPSLLVSHWPVRDDVAAEITVNTLRRTQAGESRAAALQNAMRDIRNDPSNPTFAHPSAWAPFIIAGEGR